MMHEHPDIPLDGGVPQTPRQVSKTRFLLRSKTIKRDRLRRDLAEVESEIRDIENRLSEAVAS